MIKYISFWLQMETELEKLRRENRLLKEKMKKKMQKIQTSKEMARK